MSRDQNYKWGWRPDAELDREADHLGDAVPDIRYRRRLACDLNSGVNRVLAYDRERSRRPHLDRAAGLLEDAMDTLRASQQRQCVQLLGEVAGSVVNAGGTATIRWFDWPVGLPDGSMRPAHINHMIDLCRQARSSLMLRRLDSVLACIRDATLTPGVAEYDLEEAAEAEEQHQALALRTALVKEAEDLAKRPDSASRRRMRSIRREWNEALWLSDDGAYRALDRRLNHAAECIFQSDRSQSRSS